MILSGYFKAPKDDKMPVLVCLHAFPLDYQMWMPFIDEINDLPIGIFAPNMRGYDGAEVPTPEEDPEAWSIKAFAQDVIESIKEKNIPETTPLILMGCSMGAYIIFELWRTHADRIQKIIIVDSRPNADSPEVRQNRKAQRDIIARDGTERLIAATVEGLLAPKSKEKDELFQSILSMGNGIPPAAISGTLFALANRPDSTPLLPSITVPTFIVVGSLDTVSPISVASKMSRLIPDSSVCIINGAGHLPPLESTPVFVQMVRPILLPH